MTPEDLIRRAMLWELYSAFLKEEVASEGLPEDGMGHLTCESYLSLAEIAVEIWEKRYSLENRPKGEIQ